MTKKARNNKNKANFFEQLAKSMVLFIKTKLFPWKRANKWNKKMLICATTCNNIVQLSQTLTWVYCWYWGWKLCMASCIISLGFMVSFKELEMLCKLTGRLPGALLVTEIIDGSTEMTINLHFLRLYVYWWNQHKLKLKMRISMQWQHKTFQCRPTNFDNQPPLCQWKSQLYHLT